MVFFARLVAVFARERLAVFVFDRLRLAVVLARERLAVFVFERLRLAVVVFLRRAAVVFLRLVAVVFLRLAAAFVFLRLAAVFVFVRLVAVFFLALPLRFACVRFLATSTSLPRCRLLPVRVPSRPPMETPRRLAPAAG